MTDAPVAGWYSDPDDAASDRWWDGAAWSDHRRAHGQVEAGAAAAAAPAAAPAYAPTPTHAPPQYTAPPFAPAPYGSAPYASAPYGYAQPSMAPVIPNLPVKNTLAVAGLIVALCAVPLSFINLSLFAIVGGVTGALVAGAGRTRAKRLEAAGHPNSRMRIAIAGMVIGWIVGGAALVWTILNIAQFFGSF